MCVYLWKALHYFLLIQWFTFLFTFILGSIQISLYFLRIYITLCFLRIQRLGKMWETRANLYNAFVRIRKRQLLWETETIIKGYSVGCMQLRSGTDSLAGSIDSVSASSLPLSHAFLCIAQTAQLYIADLKWCVEVLECATGRESQSRIQILLTKFASWYRQMTNQDVYVYVVVELGVDGGSWEHAAPKSVGSIASKAS